VSYLLFDIQLMSERNKTPSRPSTSQNKRDKNNFIRKIPVSTICRTE